MTRISRRKKSNTMKKQVLKSCLVAVLIGALGTVGSFAYFTSSASVKSNLIVKTGSINVDIENKFGNHITTRAIKIAALHPGNNESSPIIGQSKFKIKNIGSLNQKVKLSFKSTGGVTDSKFLENINYNITYTTKDNSSIQIQSGNMNELINEGITLSPIDANKNPITLKEGQVVDCVFEASLNSGIDRGYSGKSVHFNLTVEANQVNKE